MRSDPRCARAEGAREGVLGLGDEEWLPVYQGFGFVSAARQANVGCTSDDVVGGTKPRFNNSVAIGRFWPGGHQQLGDPMKNVALKIQRFLVSEDGPTAVEYAVMLALIIVVCIAAITTLGSNANETFGNVSLNTAGS